MEFTVEVKVAKESLPRAYAFAGLNSINGNGCSSVALAPGVEPTRRVPQDMVALKVWMRSHLTPRGIRLLSDRGRMDVESTKVAVMALSAVPLAYNRHSWAVLGDLDHAGEDAADAHRAIGHFCAGHYIDGLVGIGSLALHYAAGAMEEGMAEERVEAFRTSSQALAYLRERVSPGDVLLVKGTRSMSSDGIVAGLCAI